MPAHLSSAERRALTMPPGEAIPLSSRDLDDLLIDPAYRPSVGQPPHARHFRRSLPNGCGLHLVLTDAEAGLHWDRFDPHGGPAGLALHLATESPREALSALACAVAVLRRLGG